MTDMIAPNLQTLGVASKQKQLESKQSLSKTGKLIPPCGRRSPGRT